MGEMSEPTVDYSAMYEAACYRYGIDNVTDKTYSEYPLPGSWKPIDEGLRKFEVDVKDTDIDPQELREELESHGYQVRMKGDERFSSGACPYKYVAVVTEGSEPVPYEEDNE